MSPSSSADTRPPGRWRDYLALSRPDHWIKHIFILPGIVLAYVLLGPSELGLVLPIAVGLAAAAATASANYVINEWLDADSDAFHPLKSTRPAVAKRLSPFLVYSEFVALAVAGLLLARTVSTLFFATTCLFLMSGLLYNVRPFRSKDRVFVDVLSESLNNPIRLTLGWAMVSSATLPPASLLIAYWMGGAFLMDLKRLAELRSALARGRSKDLERYRRSFRYYTQHRLLLAGVLYALMAAFFLAIFLIKYRIEYLLSLPLFAALFVAYLAVALEEDSSVQAPERLFREPSLVLLVALLGGALLLLTWIDLPILDRLTDPHYIHLSPD